jgi:hypothetical protein
MAREKPDRRTPEKQPDPPRDESPPFSPEDAMRGSDRTPDDLSVRAKSSGHGKKTADKWNQ